ncbi:MAG: S8 family serine peptidase, partial [Anaerolineae bacterium]|nr:S8 family serine peptidase [Anaerolineae bacterium]
MKSKTLGLLIAIVLVVLLAAPVGALPAPDQAVPAPNTGEPGVYIVRFEGASLASYEGGIAGLEATSPAATGEARLDAKSPASLAYLDYLAGRHDQFVAAMERTLDRSVEVLYRYDVVLNGMAVRMTGQEAAQVAALPGVVDVQLETIEQPDTVDSVPWIGAPSIWDGSAVPGGSGTYGEGVIVGILDTGINSDHPSFAATGPVDGYVHINPYGAGVYVGHCVANPGFCNDKLIGAWNYTDGPEDTNGHGSHTASTVAGNFVNAGITTPSGFVVNAQISGVAPHANVIMYDVCDAGGCGSAGSVAAINQAVLDGVDAINYSISGGNNPYSDLVELAFLDANTAGIFVSTSAGNNGPGASTVAHRSPWVSTVAASTHNRLYTTGLINMSGGSTTPPADMSGQSISTGIDNRPIVYAGNYGDPLCGTPFPGGTWTNEIVVCDRGGGIARVDKGANVLAGGADGFVLANDAASGDSLVADAHYLPAVHITYDDGVILKAWLADGGAGHTATIPATTADLSPANGDIMASFSSRGPNTTFDALKPDMTAPGVAVLAASMNGIEYEWMGGTSMSSPHNAGAGALMKALYPSWTPSEIKSAIMTTSETDNLRKEDGVTPADPFDVGAGRDDLMYAALAGIVFDETRANYEAANPATGGDPKTLNVPSLQDSNCGGTCSWTRVVSSTQSAAVTWTASGTGMGFTFSPASFSLPAGATQEIVITANVAGLPIGSWAFGEVTLTPSDSSIPEAHLPVAVIPSGDVPVISVEPAGFDTTQQV